MPRPVQGTQNFFYRACCRGIDFVHWDGMFDGQDRETDLKSVESLLALVREHVTAAGEVQLYPVWDGKEGKPPKGVINLGMGALNRERFFFNEQVYRVTAAPE